MDAVSWLARDNAKRRSARLSESAMRLNRLMARDRAYKNWLVGNGGMARHEIVIDHGDYITRYRGTWGGMA